MYTSAFFNSKNGDRMYKAESFADYFASFIGNGVFPNPSSGLHYEKPEEMKRKTKNYFNKAYFLVFHFT